MEGETTILRWCLSLGAKFIRVVPGVTVLVILLTLISQVSMVLAFLLPLKVVILLGSTGIPRYFPTAFAELDRDMLIIALGTAAAGFYLTHLISERLIARGVNFGTKQLLDRSQKLVLFERQADIAAVAFQRYARAIAGGVFVLLALLALGVMYADLALLLIGFALVSKTSSSFVFSARTRSDLPFETRLANFLGLAGNLGFFITFAFLVVDFLFWTPPGLLVAIVSLLLARQVLTRGGAFVLDLYGLYLQQARINALFFHGSVLVEQVEDKDGFWALVADERRLDWICPLLPGEGGNLNGTLKCEWLQTGIHNVAGLKVRDESCGRCYLLKLYANNRNSQSMHEEMLFEEVNKFEGFPAPELLKTGSVRGFRFHLFGLQNTEQLTLNEKKSAVHKLRSELLRFEPPSSLVDRYLRSRPMLWQSFRNELVSSLRLAARDTTDGQLLTEFETHLDFICEELKKLPVVVFNPDLTPHTIVRTDGCELQIHWGRWTLEPLGAGWPIQEKMLARLSDVFRPESTSEQGIAELPIERVELAALCSMLIKECRRQMYSNALDILPPLLERVELLVPSEISEGQLDDQICGELTSTITD